MIFSLLTNPFAVLSADPTMSADTLTELAAREGTPQTAAALHTLTAPRTRLTAEVAFLPGVSGSVLDVLQGLRRGERPSGAFLQGQALANVLAHLAGADQADGDIARELVGAQPERGSPTLLAAVARDRLQAGQPAPQPAMLETAQDEIAEAHAAVVVRLCSRDPTGAETLAGLIREADGVAAVAFLRRCAAVWARENAGRTAAADEAVARAEAALSRAPGEATTAAFIRGLTEWAELTAPERLTDAASGLDHEPSAAKARRWRGLAQRLAESGSEPTAVAVAVALVATLGEMPGFATLLRRDRDTFAAAVSDRALTAAFEPLMALARRLGAEPDPLRDALLARGFGPAATGAAAELWTAFARVREAAPASERPFAVLDELAGKLDASGASDAAVVLLKALAQAAGQAGLAEPAERLRGHERVLLRRVGLARLQGLTTQWWKARRAVKEIDALLPLADDPALRTQLSATRRRMQRRVATMASSVAVGCAVLALVVIGLSRQVSEGRGSPAPSAGATIAAVPVERAPTTTDRDIAAAPDVPAGTPLPAAEPRAGLAPAEAPTTPQVDPDGSGSKAVPAALPVIHFDPTTPPEAKPIGFRQVYTFGSGVFQKGSNVLVGPRGVEQAYSPAQVRWCLFNEVRLKTVSEALAEQDKARKDMFNRVAAPWNELCSRYRADRGVTARVERETREYHGALVLQAQEVQHEIETAAP